MHSPAAPDQVEQVRMDTKVKGEVICKRCGGPAGNDRCGRLHDPNYVWECIPEALLQIDEAHEWQGEKWGIRATLQSPTVAGYSKDCLVGWKGEEANYCLQLPNDVQIHVRWQDRPVYEYTVHREFDPNRNLVGHVCDVIGGNTKRMRDDFRLTWSTYDDPDHLVI